MALAIDGFIKKKFQVKQIYGNHQNRSAIKKGVVCLLYNTI